MRDEQLEKIRDAFPMMKGTMHDKPLVYLDSAATTQKPSVVIDAMAEFLRTEYATVHRAVYELSVRATERYSAVRRKVAAFINAPSEQTIVFTRGTTDGINLVASSFGKRYITSGDEVIITQTEHHSNIVPWQIMCQERGAFLRVIPVDDNGELLLDEYAQMLNERTKIVALAHVSNALGTVHPIKEVIAMARHVGAFVLVDGAQSIPHIPVDVQDLDADFYLFSGHKIYGPTGVGVLFGKQNLLEELPPYQGGGDMIETVTIEKATYQPPPMKFEAGTPMITEIIGLGTALDYLSTIGMEKISAYEKTLFEYALERLQQSEIKGLTLFGPPRERRAGIISFIVDGLHPLDIGTLLDFKGVAVRTGNHCSQPTMKRLGISSTVRMSLGMYNNERDVDAFINALKEVVALLRS